MIKITCTSCQKPLSLDETKLPMKEVSFPCPVCKTKLTVDRRNLTAEGPASPAASRGVPAAPVQDNGDDDNENEFGAKAFLVGTDSPALRQAAKLIGYLPVFYATAEQARDRFMQDAPQVVFLSPPQMTPPPLEAMQPIIGLLPADRRKSFFILISDNLRTLDGNAAFLYGVNLIVATKDLGNFSQIFRDAYGYHERLYASMNSVLRAMEGG
ncbi:MAG TPA: hypothetical protein VM779_04060 [Thermoanaerobaculia bacterium]|nr:hypothetical protein [Thermoanaerobaculia bacterium]